MDFFSSAGALWAGLAAAFLAAGLTGCIPNSVTISLDGSGGPLREASVLADQGRTHGTIAQLDLTGLITDGPGSGFIAQPNPVDEFLIRLERAANDDRVRAILVRIDSPGGSVTASDILYSELRRVRERTGKPIVASLGEVAASGGYYVALAADEIVAHPTSITGSIGVIIPTFNVSDGLSRIGVHARAVVSGPNKNMADPFEPARSEHYAILQEMVNEYYGRFRSLVAERRAGIDRAELDALTDGRVLTGAEAVRTGLADQEGSVRDAFESAKRLAGLERAELVKYIRAKPNGEISPYALASAESAGSTLAQRPGLLDALPLGALALDAGVPYYVWLP